MSYKLKKPYTENERMDFIVQYNHNQSLTIAEGTDYLYALLPNEIMIGGIAVINPDYEAEQERKEAERVAQLNMTRGDFFEGLILSVGKDEDDVLALIDIIDLTETERKIYRSRVKNALDFYRGYPLIDVMCGYLNINPDNMTLFFETKDYTHLIPTPEAEEPDGEISNNEVSDTTTTDTTAV